MEKIYETSRRVYEETCAEFDAFKEKLVAEEVNAEEVMQLMQKMSDSGRQVYILEHREVLRRNITIVGSVASNFGLDYSELPALLRQMDDKSQLIGLLRLEESEGATAS